MIKRIQSCLMLLISVVLLNACIVYHLDVPQGNEVTQDKVAKLRQGLTKAQVQYLLGTALLQDSFHPDRWDYVYLDVVNDKIKQEKRFTVFFENDRLLKWEGDVLPISEAARVRLQQESKIGNTASYVATQLHP